MPGRRAAVVTAGVNDGVLALEVRDDGVGGADPNGHGLVGIADRVEALGGRLRIDSPRGGGTVAGRRAAGSVTRSADRLIRAGDCQAARPAAGQSSS